MTDRERSKPQQWGDLQAASAAANETKDCGIKALAVATGLPYDECRAALIAAGREPRGSTWTHQIHQAAKTLGFRSIDRFDFPRVTMRKAADHCRIGVGAIIFATRHFAGWDGHQIIDWSADSRKRINWIIDILPKGERL